MAVSLSAFPDEIIDIEKYYKTGSVSSLISDVKFQDELKLLLKNDYRDFIGNFDMIASPYKIANGGLFVEGWLQDLYLYNASAFIIKPDGHIYAAWLTPKNTAIKYASNDPNQEDVPEELKK